MRSPALLVTLLAATLAVPAAPLAAQDPARPAPPARPTGTATVTGVVVDSVGRPIAGARVRVEEFFRADGAPSRDSTVTDAAGAFRIGGLTSGGWVLKVEEPAHLGVETEFEIGAGVTASLRITMNPAPPPPPPPVAGAEPGAAPGARGAGGAQIVGTVRTTAGRVVAGAQVAAMGTAITTTTDSTGTFRLTRLAGGPYFLRVRKLGFEPVVFSATVQLGDSLGAAVTLSPIAGVAGQRLDTVKVMADFGRMSQRLRGFEDRRRTANGLFITKEEIDLRRPSVVTDLLRGRASLTVQRNNATGGSDVYGPRLSINSGYCPLALIVDGTLIQNASGAIDSFVPVDMIAGIEVYATGTRVPSEFQRLGTDCGAIVVWTR